MKQANAYRNICSTVIVVTIAVFIFLLRYDVPLYGDDVGGLVFNNPDSTYIDESVVVGECELNLDYSLSATWEKLVYSYSAWDGRVTAKLIMPLLRIIFSLPDGMGWLVFSIYIMAMMVIMYMMTLQTIGGSVRKGLDVPMIVLLTGVLLFYIPSYSYAYMTRLIMYTFTNIYVVSVILYLAFYGAVGSVFERHADMQTQRTAPTVRALSGINLIGLLAGLSHEAYGVIFGMVLLIQLVKFWLKNHRRISGRYLFMYAGYFIGFCICFFAPGNFNRAQQSHESALYSVSLGERLLNSIYIHAFVAYRIWIVPVVVLPVLVVFVVVLLRKKILTGKNLLTAVLDNLEWFLGFAMSAITWGLVARVVNYGMLAANVILIIGVIRTLRELWMFAADKLMAREGQFERIQRIAAGVSTAVVVFLAVGNYSDMSSAHQTADIWRENLSLARKVGMEEITVPTYPEELNPKFYDIKAINSQGSFDRVSYRVVYGTHVVIDYSRWKER